MKSQSTSDIFVGMAVPNLLRLNAELKFSGQSMTLLFFKEGTERL